MSEDKRPSMAVIVSTVNSPEFQAKMSASLPKGVNADRFSRMTITALQAKPELLEADKDSLYLAILQCAQTGLAPDGKKAALVVFNTNVGGKGKPDRWVKLVQFMPMVTGIIEKLGEVGVKCDTATVHENDVFEWEQGDNPKIVHKPAKLGTERGVTIGAYAILKLKGGEPYHEVMDTKEIEAVRKQSKSPNSLMWTQFYGEACRKTVLRRCAKRIPIPYDESVERTLEADNATFDLDPPGATTEPKADPTVVAEQTKQPAQVEQAKAENDPQAIQQSMPKQQVEAQPEESENPAPQEEPKKAAATKPPAQSAPKRPKVLETVAQASDDNEDIF